MKSRPPAIQKRSTQTHRYTRYTRRYTRRHTRRHTRRNGMHTVSTRCTRLRYRRVFSALDGVIRVAACAGVCVVGRRCNASSASAEHGEGHCVCRGCHGIFILLFHGIVVFLVVSSWTCWTCRTSRTGRTIKQSAAGKTILPKSLLWVIVTFLSPKNRELVVYVTFYHLKSLYLFVPMWFISV